MMRACVRGVFVSVCVEELLLFGDLNVAICFWRFVPSVASNPNGVVEW